MLREPHKRKLQEYLDCFTRDAGIGQFSWYRFAAWLQENEPDLSTNVMASLLAAEHDPQQRLFVIQEQLQAWLTTLPAEERRWDGITGSLRAVATGLLLVDSGVDCFLTWLRRHYS